MNSFDVSLVVAIHYSLLTIHFLSGALRMAEPVTVDVQPTPNVNALKFVVNRRLTEGRSQTFRTPQEAAASPLAAALLAVPGVVQVFFLNDFITVTRDPSVQWENLADQVESTIRGHFDEQRGS